MFIQYNFPFPFFSQLTFFCKHFIFKRCINIIDKIKPALLKFKKFSSLIFEERNFNAIEVGQTLSQCCLFQNNKDFF